MQKRNSQAHKPHRFIPWLHFCFTAYLLTIGCSQQPETHSPRLAVNQEGVEQRMLRHSSSPPQRSHNHPSQNSAEGENAGSTAPNTQKTPQQFDSKSLRDGRREQFSKNEEARINTLEGSPNQSHPNKEEGNQTID